jgi:hypothetical protein
MLLVLPANIIMGQSDLPGTKAVKSFKTLAPDHRGRHHRRHRQNRLRPNRRGPRPCKDAGKAKEG